MRRSRVLAAIVLLLIGLLWIGQGSGALAGSAMSGNSLWAAVGAACVVVGLAIGVREILARPVRP